MSQDEFVQKLASRIDVADAEGAEMTGKFISLLIDELNAGNTVAVQGFGVFEAKRKAERKMYNPSSKDFKIIPSKVSLNFKMSNALKGRINS